MKRYKDTVIVPMEKRDEPAFFFVGPRLVPLPGNVVQPETPRHDLFLLIDVFHRAEVPDDTLTLPTFVPTQAMLDARRPLNVPVAGFVYHECVARLHLMDPAAPQRGDEWMARRLYEFLKGSSASRTLRHLRYASCYVRGVPASVVARQDWLEEMAALRPSAKLETHDGRKRNYLIHHMVRGTDWEDRAARDFADYGHLIIPAHFCFPARPLLLEAGTVHHPYFDDMTVSIDRIEAATGYIIEIKCPTPRDLPFDTLPDDYGVDSPSLLPDAREITYYEDTGPFDRDGSGDYYHQVNMQAFTLGLPTVFLVKYNIVTGGMKVVRCHIDVDWFSRFGPELMRAQRDVLRLRRDTGWTPEKHAAVNQ